MKTSAEASGKEEFPSLLKKTLWLSSVRGEAGAAGGGNGGLHVESEDDPESRQKT